jgi:pimeloyl-ACP methyl ester carboxylesterase
MACDAITFLTALGLGEADLLGFSIGSFVAQEIALTRPALVRSLIAVARIATPIGAAMSSSTA